MATLTQTEKKAFTAAQLVQVAKLTTLDLPPAERSNVLDEWARKTPVQLRGKVCLDHISWGRGGASITWSSRCDISAVEAEAIQVLLLPGTKYEQVFEDVIGGKRSVEQRLAALEA